MMDFDILQNAVNNLIGLIKMVLEIALQWNSNWKMWASQVQNNI